MSMKIDLQRAKQLAYAKEREAIHLQWINRADRDLNREINEIMRYARETIRTESQAWLIKYAEAEGITLTEASKRAAGADIRALERKAAQYVKNRDLSQIANREMRLYNYSMRMSRHELLRRHYELELDQSFIKIEGLIHNHLQMMGLTELERQAGLLGKTVVDREAYKMKAGIIADASFHGATFSERVWENQEALKKILDDGLRKSIIMGKHPTAWMKDMDQFLDRGMSGSTYALKRLAVTESARVQIAAQREIYRANGYENYMVVCEPTACDICIPLDGAVFKVIEMREGDNAPPFHPNCKCSTAATTEDDLRESDELVGNDVGKIVGA